MREERTWTTQGSATSGNGFEALTRCRSCRRHAPHAVGETGDVGERVSRVIYAVVVAKCVESVVRGVLASRPFCVNVARDSGSPFFNATLAIACS